MKHPPDIDLWSTAAPVHGTAVALRLPLALAALLALGTALAAHDAWQAHALLQHATAQAATPAAPPADPAQQALVDALAAQLDHPWDTVFATLEQQLDTRVAVLAYEDGARRRSARLTLGASRPADALAAVEALAAAPALAGARVVRQDRLPGTDGERVHYSVELQWRHAARNEEAGP
jgi:hypothetical protein